MLRNSMKITIHQTHHAIADFEQIYNYLSNYFKPGHPDGLHIFPELFLTGYPLQDLLLQRPFNQRYHEFLARLDNWGLKNFKSKGPQDCMILLGGPSYIMDELANQEYPKAIFNSIFQLSPGTPLKKIYDKILLPNYDIYDEKKYFAAGDQVKIVEFAGKNIGLQICEDMWPSSLHDRNPSLELKLLAQNQKCKLDLVVNLSASPFNLGKEAKRLLRGKEISKLLDAPFIYCNRVGGEDEILFDGGSFVVQSEQVLHQCPSFSPDVFTFDSETLVSAKSDSSRFKETGIVAKAGGEFTENTWESLFLPNLDYTDDLPVLSKLTPERCHSVLNALQFGLQEYAAKSNMNKFLIAVSGGIDSALVLAIAHLGLKAGQEIEAIFMPSIYSSTLSYDLTYQMCQTLQIKFTSLPIKFIHATVRNLFREHFSHELDGLANENVQSRLRGTLLYTRSNQTGAMVINTSNKSELAVGYSTQYGDSVGAISLLGDLYKTEIFQLAHYINDRFGEIIPKSIIDRPPTAELRTNQTDEESLLPYPKLDAILECILCYRMGLPQIESLGFTPAEISKVYALYQKSEFKRSQFCPIIKLKSKSFGFGYRVPICKKMI